MSKPPSPDQEKPRKKRRQRDWGDVYYAALDKGYDHGYAAYCADEAMKRQNRRKPHD